MSLFKKKAELPEKLPRHIAIIMDGNGRWAKKRGLPRTAGHKRGANNFRTITNYINDLGIEYITFYAFSTENWKRSQEEVKGIMTLFKNYMTEALERLKETDMRLLFIGDRSVLDEDLQKLMDEIEQDTADHKGTVVNMAINYGGRQEICDACKKIALKVKNGELQLEDITEDVITAHIYTAGQPDPDLIIRPSGELRLSNFLIWQAAYSEFWFDDILWPDFSVEDLNRALVDYSERNRRFGGVK